MVVVSILPLFSIPTSFFKGIHDRYRATALSFSHMLNSDYVPPAADDEKLNSPTKTPQKQRPIEAKNLSSSMSVLEDISSQTSEVPALEDLEDEELAGILLFLYSRMSAKVYL